MSFTNNKAIQMTDFLARLHERIKATGNIDAQIFFKSFLQDDLVKKIKGHQGMALDWDGLMDVGNFDKIYGFARNLLFEAAARNFAECCPNIYADAKAVSVAFCEEFNELSQRSGEDGYEPICIVSITDSMVDAGLALVVVDGGIHLTRKGRELAQSVRRYTA